MKLFSRQIGPGEATNHVVILHGLFAASDNLQTLGKALSEHYRVHLLDLRNHGQSPQASELNYGVMAQDVIEYLDDQKIEQAALIGHSMGGKTAMQVALNYPHRVKGLIVADIAPVRYDPGHEHILEGLQALEQTPVTSRKMADETLSQWIDEWGVRQFLIKSLRRADDGSPGLVWRFNYDAIKKNYLEILSAPQGDRYDGPVLFIAGARSDYILPEHKDQTLRLFPHAQLKIIPDTSHWLHAEKPEVFNAMCVRFLNQAFISQ